MTRKFIGQMENVRYTYYGEEKFFHSHADRIMGTRYDMIVSGLDDSASRTLWESIADLLRKGDAVFDRFSSESEVFKVNRSLSESGSSLLSPILGAQIKKCLDYSRRTSGLFDITRGHIDGIHLSEDLSSIETEDNAVNLDFGGYAKGWALKGIVEILKAEGVESAFVDFGGSSIYAMGSHPSGNGWLVDLPSPFDAHTVASYALHDEALSTSGNTPWYTGHIVNPYSGEKEMSRALSTVRCSDPLDAEVLSTVYMICDQEQRTEIENNFPDAKFEKFNL